MQARKAKAIVKFEGKDITTSLEDYLSSISYTDNEEEAADDLQLALEDREGNWINNWLEQTGGKGLRVEAKIIQEEDGQKKGLYCGKFQIDNITSSGPPDKVTIKAVSIPSDVKLSSEKKSKAWEKIKLSEIGNEIAKKNKLGYLFDSSTNPKYERREQSKKTDIEFLRELCKDAGVNLKITGNKLVLFDAAKYEKQKPVGTIIKGRWEVFSYRFATNMKDTGYSSCEVTYTDSKTKKTIKGKFENPKKSRAQKVLKVNTKVSSVAEANELARKQLREKNKNETQANMEVLGNVYFVAGAIVKIQGWGLYDGTYIIQSASHSVSSSGYKTSLSIRKILEGY